MKKSILILGVSLALISLTVVIVSNNKSKSILEQNIEVLAQNEGTSSSETSSQGGLKGYHQVSQSAEMTTKTETKDTTTTTTDSSGTKTTTTHETVTTTTVTKYILCCEPGRKKQVCPFGESDCVKYGLMPYAG